MTSRRELVVATIVFAVLAVAVIAFSRPFDLTAWISVAVCALFVSLGSVAIAKPDVCWRWREPRSPVVRNVSRTMPVAEVGEGATIAEPTAQEWHILEATIAALEEAGALMSGEIDARMLWDGAQRVDPGRPVGYDEALGALGDVREVCGIALPRLTFIPVHVEYDANLLAAITVSVLTSLGHEDCEANVSILPTPDSPDAQAVITVTAQGLRETMRCPYLWKDASPDLFTALANMRRDDDPRELVCADPGDQTLLFAAIHPNARVRLNQRFPVGYDMFTPP